MVLSSQKIFCGCDASRYMWCDY